MKTTRTVAICLTLGLVAGAAGWTHAAAPAAKSGAFQTDLVGQISYLEKQIMDLEEAVPQDKFTWRPAPGVRSIAEAYLHIAYGNYGLGKVATGKTPPEGAGFGADPKKWDTQTTDKAAIKKILQASFDGVKEGLKNVPDKDLDKKVSFFGHDMSTRGVMMAISNHEAEHLGQSIAYARANKVTPPWSKNE
jgi:uncharacterized damage-inducible protein DinB